MRKTAGRQEGTFGGATNDLKPNAGDGCTTLSIYKKILELYTEVRWILWHVNYTSIKLLAKQKGLAAATPPHPPGAPGVLTKLKKTQDKKRQPQWGGSHKRSPAAVVIVNWYSSLG